MNPIENRSKPIFKNLDGIRFIAFLGVFISHSFYPRTESVKASSLFKSVSFFVGDSHWGNFGLYLFFVMSGFLITYLLIHENQVFGKIHVSSFYIRRILRIWPLYFLLVIFNFFVYPYLIHNSSPNGNQLPYFLFYANLDVIKNGFNHGIIGHMWAVSVEEQFYLLLPLCILLVSVRYLHVLFGFVIISSLIFRAMRHNEPVVLYHHSFSAAFDIALGGLAAWIMYFSATAKTFIVSLSRNIILTVYIVFLGVILFQDYIFGLNQLTISLFLFQLFAAFIIIEQNYASHSFFKIGDNKWISTLGKCAYGFFCYHIICIRVTEGLAIKYGVYGSLGEVVVIPILSFLVTILTGWVSYHLFESPFLKLKSKFSYLK